MSQSQSLPSDKIIGRIRKLLAFAADGRGNEAEMANAAALAQELMSEYNLEIASLEAEAPSQDDPDPARAERTRTETGRSAARDWQIQLMRTIARNHFCRHWVSTVHAARRPGGTVRARKRHFLIGRRVNVELAQATYDYVVGAMDRLYPEDLYGDRKGISAQSWFRGCAGRIDERLIARRQESEVASAVKKPATPGTHLVTLTEFYGSEDDLNYDAYWGHPPGTTAARRRERAAAEAANKEQNDAFWAKREAAQAAERAAETPAARRKREEREAREHEKWNRKYWRHQDKLASRHDAGAYSRGAAAGDRVGLDVQVGSTRSPAKGIK